MAFRAAPRNGHGPSCAGLFINIRFTRQSFFAVLGAGFAVVLTGGFSGTLHAWFGLGTIAFGVLQIVSASFRGSHGGRKDPSADPEDRSTWGGDHFDMATQRWWFEAYHKIAGYFAILLAMGAVVDPFAGCGHPLTGRYGGRMADDRCQFPMAARLHAQDTKAIFDIVECNALDQAGESLLCGWGRAWFHAAGITK